jgi:hypothetical protein
MFVTSDMRTVLPAGAQADNLRQMAEVVELRRLNSSQWINSLHQLPARKLPPEIAEAAAAVEGAGLSWLRLAAFLRRLADRIENDDQ